MTEGQIQIFNGHFVLDDEQRMTERASAVMEKVWAEAESAGWFDHAPA